jgi:DNA-binding NtrC family response regulator
VDSPRAARVLQRLASMAHAHEILIVDDDDDVRTLLSQRFADYGYLVTGAADAMKAIELVDNGSRPCVVLVDLVMPGIVGQELLEYMHTEVPDIPIAIVSGSPHLAPDGYVVFGKPISMTELLAFVVSSCRLENESQPTC